MRALPVLLVLLSSPALAQEPGPEPCQCEGTCLSEEDKKTVVDGLNELKKIKESKAEVKLKDDIVIVRDWEDRVYVNGGSAKPVRMTLKLGTVERDLEVQLPVHVSYREKPPDPMFRLRIRAQAGVLIPELVGSFSDGLEEFWDAGIGWDFVHLGPWNMSAYTGIRSAGGGVGLDLTRNFGPYAGYSFVYEDLRSSVFSGVFFSFN